MSTKNPVSAYKSRNRHRKNRIRDVLASMQQEAQSSGIPFDVEAASYLLNLFEFCFISHKQKILDAMEVLS